MAVAEIRIEAVEAGSIAAGDLAAASLRVLQCEPDIRFRVTPTGTVIRGERHRVLAAARLIERAFCSSCREGYLMTITVNEERNHRQARPAVGEGTGYRPTRGRALRTGSA